VSGGACSCDALAYRYLVQVEQRRDVDATVTALRARLKEWHTAALEAYAALEDKPVQPAGVVHPQDLRRAARRRSAA
jgi:hypothetical protein